MRFSLRAETGQLADGGEEVLNLSVSNANAGRREILSANPAPQGAIFMTEKNRWKMVVASVAGIVLWRRLVGRYSFANKVAIVTGGSRGLGLAIARQLVRQGAKVAILARDHDELIRAKNGFGENSESVTTWSCDVKNDSAVQSTIHEIAETLGTIDLLVNNAGEIVVGPLASMKRQDFEDALNIHFWAPFSLISATLPYLKQHGDGRIVNVASFGGKLAVPHLAPYCVSKFALVGYSNALHAELTKDKVHVTTVAPGLMRTGSHKNAFFKGDQQKEFAWFSLGAANPFVSMDANRAARQIVEAVRHKKSTITVTMPAKLGVLIQALAPELTARVLAIASSCLPGMPETGGNVLQTGWESGSIISPSPLTWLADHATKLLNGLRGHVSATKR
jgi:short-subunit dehydrogenase